MGEVGIVHVRRGQKCFRIQSGNFTCIPFSSIGVGVVSAGHFYGTFLSILEWLELLDEIKFEFHRDPGGEFVCDIPVSIGTTITTRF
jgi:hypothetical protein